MLVALAILALGSIVSACFLTPIVYEILGYFMGKVPWPYSRVFDRVIMLCALVAIILLRKRFNLSEIAVAWRGSSTAAAFKKFGMGLLLTLAATLLVFPLLVDDNKFLWADHSFDYYLSKLPKVVAGALILSFIEESFFRVMLFSALKRTMPLIAAAVVSSIVYSTIHFFSPVSSYIYPGYNLTVGFDYMVLLFHRFALPGIPAALFGLFLVGMVLCFTIERTRSFWLCVGLHAGWVISVKLAFLVVYSANEANFPAGIGRRYFLVAQPLAWGSILLVFAAILLALRYRRAAPLLPS